jgi:hypothetical protein
MRTLGVIGWTICFGMFVAACEERGLELEVQVLERECFECDIETGDCARAPCESEIETPAEIAL